MSFISKNTGYRKTLLVLGTIIFLMSVHMSYSKTVDQQVIEIESVSHTSNTAILEMGQFISYYTANENIFIIVLYGDVDGTKGAVIVQIGTDNSIYSKYTLSYPIEDAFLWFDLDIDLIQLDGNAMYVDFQEYNLQNSDPTNVQMLAFNSLNTMDDVIADFQYTLNYFQFTDSGNNDPGTTSSNPTTSVTTNPGTTSSNPTTSVTTNSGTTSSNPTSSDSSIDSSTSPNDTTKSVNQSDSNTSKTNSSGGNISTSFGFELVFFSFALIGIVLYRKKNK